MRQDIQLVLVLALTFGLLGCSAAPEGETGSSSTMTDSLDPHSFARPDEVRVTHLALDLTVDFDHRILEGTAALEFEGEGSELVLDTRNLDIQAILLDDGTAADFSLGEEVEFLGRSLTIALPAGTKSAIVRYVTDPSAEALQWLSPQQTSGGKPFLFTQSQAILARTWVPCQDSPAVRMTYEATIRVPTGLMAVMSAENATERSPQDIYTFRMAQPIPSYLLALAVGDLAFQSLGERSGVFAEPSVLKKAAWEFAEVEEMMDAAERLYGPYRWERYDLLVLPPSFPFGGMENPRLTFATPTILAGDRSLVALVAHELAHSWSGNLVTNATWNDFWLNEGFTSYIENRIMEELYGTDYAKMLAVLSRQDLADTLEEIGPEAADTHLFLDLRNRNPDDGMTAIAYDKGAAFLATMESLAGREVWDDFLADYFSTFGFESLDTERFASYLTENLLDANPGLADKARLEEWIYGPGLPSNIAPVVSGAFDEVDRVAAAWAEGATAAELETAGWTTHHWLYFLRGLPDNLSGTQMTGLDKAFGFTTSGNSEILCAWLTVAIRNDYRETDSALEDFLTRVGRRKFLKPLYAELAKTERGLEWARGVYAGARSGYHSISAGTIDEILSWSG
ncbi:MAG: M1 family metallopeptidase [Acidobacteriota bacterium]|nr:M1 family metallopeptidase [Acidobacteriota bacterium]